MQLELWQGVQWDRESPGSGGAMTVKPEKGGGCGTRARRRRSMPAHSPLGPETAGGQDPGPGEGGAVSAGNTGELLATGLDMSR
ncbi:hypothetical protein ANANG_G00203660 [Anguilla anguilla]|uniref:Uncharacterized protein n=1 Tax=Anguilla anguilla TaxID=7936 RepID=A0A9D3RQL6_ANGAN|nr:hypothetical protein ANANG_G00203660 [Anguilla anguilla]